MNMRGISDKAKADLLSKTYIYGYVENYPYEFSMAGHMEGISVEYLKRIIKLTNIDINFQRYESVEKLQEAVKTGKVDIFFNYFNSDDSKYLKSKPVFLSKYVVIGKAHNVTIDNLESLRGKDVSTLSNSVISSYIKANIKANVSEKKSRTSPFISHEDEFKAKSINQDTDVHFTIIKGPSHPP